MILWLHGKTQVPPVTRGLLLSVLKQNGLQSTDIIFNTLHVKVSNLAEHPKKGIPPASYIRVAKEALAHDCNILRPNLIVVNDEPTLRALTGQPYTLAQVRGSVYDFQGIPVLIVDKFSKLQFASEQSKFMYKWDLAKLVRFAKGRQKNEPEFRFVTVRALSDVRYHCARARNALFLAEDIETKGGFISCISFTYDYNGHLYTFCVPFFDPSSDDGSYWKDIEEEKLVRQELAELQTHPVYKCFQNGTYDCAYEIEELMPPQNYLLDTAVMMHSIWCEMPKALQNICSYFLDSYRYWKDEAKGSKEDGFGKNRSDLERYWRYNGLDSHYTYLACVELLKFLNKFPWAMKNYNTTFSLGAGPCLAASLRGIRVNRNRHAQIMAKKWEEAKEGVADVRRNTDETDFNPNSPKDVAWFIYDILGAKQTRLQKRRNSKYGPRSTDEKVLKLIKEQGCVVTNNFINRLLEAKKPAAIISKYGNLDSNELIADAKGKKKRKRKLLRNGRFVSWLNSAATTTSRFNSGESQFWTGTNAQNIPAALREFFVADDGYVFCEIDYSASDDHFIAYEAQDPVKIEVVEDKTKDVHCRHASIFFSIDYEKILAGKKKKEPWVVDSTIGVRQNTKRVTHGRNFGEEAGTMYNVMGRDAVIATALALGFKNALKFGDEQLIGVCQILIDKYDHPIRGMYKRLRPWKREVVEKTIKNDNIATFAFGFTRKFLGDLKNDADAQRELFSCFGQSGTAGNINRALHEVWYRGIDDGKTCLFLLQNHDSLLLAIHKDAIHNKISEIREIMERKTTIHGREMGVPAEPKLGLTWSENMLPYSEDLTYEKIAQFDKDVFDKLYPPAKVVDTAQSKTTFEINVSDVEAFFSSLSDAADDDIEDEESDDDDEILEIEPDIVAKVGVKLDHANS